MDKFDQQIAMLKPTESPARLDEKQFMKKLGRAHRALRMQWFVMAPMAMALLAIMVGAIRRDIFGLFSLTTKYFTELPSMFSQYASAYLAAISWPSAMSFVLLLALGIGLVRMRKHIANVDQRTYQYALTIGVLALGLGVLGLFSSSVDAAAQQDALKRTLNERGHLELQINGRDYELYDQSKASDASLRRQAFIEELRTFDISKAYPELTNLWRDGHVAEIRAVNSKDDCIFYTERLFETTTGNIVDSSTGCITSADPILYLNTALKPAKAPKWKAGQAVYLTSARTKDDPAGLSFKSHRRILVLLDGRADDYLPHLRSEKIVPKGQPASGVQSCGINYRDECPNVGLVDVFTNSQGRLASGEIGSSIPGDSLRPQAGSSMTTFFGKILAMDGQKLQLETPSGQKLSITWPRNIVQEFNQKSAKNYPTPTGPLTIQTNDHLQLLVYYKDGMDLQKLSISDVFRIDLAIKTDMPDVLKNESYSKEKGLIEKY